MPLLRPASLALALLLTLLASPAQAGRAQAGANIGTWSTWNLDAARAEGQSWRDGAPLGSVLSVGTPLDDVARASLRVDDAAHSAAITLDASGLLQPLPGSTAQPFGGRIAVQSDLDAGRLTLQSSSQRAAYAAGLGTREAYGSNYGWAELFETFEVVYAIDRVAPINVQLQLKLSGTVLADGSDSGRVGGVQAYLHLAGVDTGESHLYLDPVWRAEASVAGETLSFSGALQPGGCSVARGLCSGFISLYAALDVRSRQLSDGAFSTQNGGTLDLDFAGQLGLSVSSGVTLVRMQGDNVLPDVAWASAAAVPEPASVALWALGLVLIPAYRTARRGSA